MELRFDCKIKGQLKRFADVMYSITEFKRKVSILSVKVLWGDCLLEIPAVEKVER